MSSYAIPHMLQRTQRSAIINLSSIEAEYPAPYLATHSATKAFVDAFSQALALEYEAQIDVLSVRPMQVKSDEAKESGSCCEASRNECAAAAINMLGLDCETNGYWVHRCAALGM
jgi:short-subunit dehydrogenase